MPNSNVGKNNVPDSCYYLCAQGVDGQNIFHDENDYQHFCSILETYLTKGVATGRSSASRKKLNDFVEVLAYCLAPNNFHLLLHQIERDGMSKLMNGVIEGYSNYFYNKYETAGPIFKNSYKISLIPSDDKLLNTSRDIHLASDEWLDYPYSSIRSYLYDDAPCWVNKKHISQLYGSAVKYLEFLKLEK